MAENFYEGFKLLEEELLKVIKNIEKPIEILEVGAKEFVSDLLRLPKPISEIRKSGYTHLVKTFTYRVEKKEIPVGWGKYYGPMQEHGTVKMNANPHVNPTWNRNKEKYYSKMIKKVYD